MSKKTVVYAPKIATFSQRATLNWEQKLIKKILKSTPKDSKPTGFTEIANRNMPKSLIY